MPAILPSINIDSTAALSKYFMLHQLIYIQADDFIHAAGKRAFVLAEKSVRVGWTFADSFKNVRKRLMYRNRDYLFVTKDWPSALEYMRLVENAADFLDYTRSIVSHGEDYVKFSQPSADGKTSSTEEIKVGYVKFDNGSRIIAFSSNPYAMAVYGGDVGLDEFAKHPNAKLLWETAQGRVTLGHDLAVWSAHDGEDTLFNQFAQQARATLSSSSSSSSFSNGNYDVHVVPNLSVGGASVPASRLDVAAEVMRRSSGSANGIRNTEHDSGFASASSVPYQPINLETYQPSTASPWNLYFRVTMSDAIELGLLDIINRTQGKSFTPEEFLADCRARSGSEEIFQQSYMCNPVGAASASIVEWSAIERCRYDYEIKRVHLENDEIKKQFGEFNPYGEQSRANSITAFIESQFKCLFQGKSIRDPKKDVKYYRLGFDVAASGQGDLSAIYIDEVIGNDLWLAGLFTARTEDWHFLKTVLFHFLRKLKNVRAAGDESGLGRQICWEAASQFSYKFKKVNFASKKHDLGFAVMNQLSVAEKRFPRAHQDIASDFFALRKMHNGVRWNFSESKNLMNQASHCDIAWAGALSTFAHTESKSCGVGAAVLQEDGTVLYSEDFGRLRSQETDPEKAEEERVRRMLLSNDPRIWGPSLI